MFSYYVQWQHSPSPPSFSSILPFTFYIKAVYYELSVKKMIKKEKRDEKFLWAKVFIVLSTLFILLNIFLSSPFRRNGHCANSISCIKNISGTYEENSYKGVFMNQTVFVPAGLTHDAQQTRVLGQSSVEKRIEIDLSQQRLYAYEGDRKIHDFLISSGKWVQTPTGNFKIWIKLRYTRMEGGSKEWGTYYNLPNVPYTMFFYSNEIPKYLGYGIHGAYWHNNFGHPMSHGCINMRTADAETLFYWTAGGTGAISNGTRVVIYGEAPPS